jgi:hypothetical protein
MSTSTLHLGTDGFTSPQKEGVLRIFFALKNPTASARFEPSNLGTKGQYAISRPLKLLLMVLEPASYVLWVSREINVLLCAPE